jgi:hypothetical protein
VNQTGSLSVYRKECKMIVQAAIRKDEIIYTGKRHHNILGAAVSFGYLKDGDQGFVTDTGEFVDRIEA